MPHPECSIITTYYRSWLTAVGEVERLRDKYAENGSDEILREFEEAGQKAQNRKREYCDKLNEDYEFGWRIIVLRDALILQQLIDRLGNFSWSENNKRVSSMTAVGRKILGLGKLYFPDELEGLDLSGIIINNPENLIFPDGLQMLILTETIIDNLENLSFPDGLQRLYLDRVIIDNPENLKLPNGLQMLYLKGATINNLEKLKIPKELEWLDLSDTTINNPENLKLPDDLLWLYLSKATISNPEKLIFPDKLKKLNLQGVDITEVFEKKLMEYKIRNPGVTIIY
jgi:hypothetical protein